MIDLTTPPYTMNLYVLVHAEEHLVIQHDKMMRIHFEDGLDLSVISIVYILKSPYHDKRIIFAAS